MQESQDKINLINGTHQKELKYWKDAVLKMALNEDKANRLKDSAPSSFLLICKPAKNAKETDIDRIISYLKSKYSADNRYQIAFVERYPSQRDVHSLSEISERLKAISKNSKESENMNLKNKTVFGEWLSLGGSAFRRNKFIKGKNLPQRFDDWIYRECGIGKQTICNYRNLFKLISVAPNLLGC